MTAGEEVERLLDRERSLFIEIKREMHRMRSVLKEERERVLRLIERLGALCREMSDTGVCFKLDRTCPWCKVDRLMDELEWLADHLKILKEMCADIYDYATD